MALSRIAPDNDGVVDLLVDRLTDPNARVRKMVIEQLRRNHYVNAKVVDILGKLAEKDPHGRVRKSAEAAYQQHKIKADLRPKNQSEPPESILVRKKLEPVRVTPEPEPVAISNSAAEQPAGQTLKTTDPKVRKIRFVEKKRRHFFLPEAAEKNNNGFAVIIGNRNYEKAGKDVPDVKYAHNDAEGIYEYVTRTLGFRKGNVIFLKDATQADLVATFGNAMNYRGRLYDWVKPDESDIFVYYSGHGAPSLADGSSYLLPVDSDPMKVELNGYPLEILYANLAKLQAKDYTLVIDACFSGSSAEGAVVGNASSISLKLKEPSGHLPNGAILTAADVAEVASWDNDYGYGLFTRQFLEGVSGKADAEKYGNTDGRITLDELESYLSEEVSYTARRLYGREQHPKVSGRDDKVFAVVSPRRAIKKLDIFSATP